MLEPSPSFQTFGTFFKNELLTVELIKYCICITHTQLIAIDIHMHNQMSIWYDGCVRCLRYSQREMCGEEAFWAPVGTAAV